MQNNNLSERLLNFSVSVVKLVTKLDKISAGKHIANQLTRCATSAGANYEEACAAESKADFIHKLQIVLKELRESAYWLRLIGRGELIRQNGLLSILKEADELVRIVAKSVITAKSRRKDN